MLPYSHALRGESVGLPASILVAKLLPRLLDLLIMMALYILPSLPCISACQLVAITSSPIILHLLFLIICRLQKHDPA